MKNPEMIELIKELMANNGIRNGRELADLIEVTPFCVYNWFKTNSQPNLNSVIKLERYLKANNKLFKIYKMQNGQPLKYVEHLKINENYTTEQRGMVKHDLPPITKTFKEEEK